MSINYPTLRPEVVERVANYLADETAMLIEELLAKQLHENFRAACKSMKVPKGPHAHDHGWCDCGTRKKQYFRKRARLLLTRACNSNPTNLGEAETNFQSLVFLRRTAVGLSCDGINRLTD